MANKKGAWRNITRAKNIKNKLQIRANRRPFWKPIRGTAGARAKQNRAPSASSSAQKFKFAPRGFARAPAKLFNFVIRNPRPQENQFCVPHNLNSVPWASRKPCSKPFQFFHFLKIFESIKSSSLTS